jgi:hypothetical protein
VELSQRARVRAGDHDEFGVLFSEHARRQPDRPARPAWHEQDQAPPPQAARRAQSPHGPRRGGRPHGDGGGHSDRAGIGIMWTSKTAKQVYKNEWIFDRTTLQFIGERIFDPKTGQVTGESAILQQAFTAKAGQRP